MQKAVGEDANIIFGAVVDETLDNELLRHRDRDRLRQRARLDVDGTRRVGSA